MNSSEWFMLENVGDKSPLMVEAPSLWEKRFTMWDMFVADSQGNPVSRAVNSPTSMIPFYLTQPGDLLPSVEMSYYPLLTVPEGLSVPADTTIITLPLILRAYYTIVGCITVESQTVYYRKPDIVDGEAWEAAVQWAGEAAPLIFDVNVARLMLYATDWGKGVNQVEAQAAQRILSLWGVAGDYQQLVVEKGRQAMSSLEPYYESMFDTPYQPLARL